MSVLVVTGVLLHDLGIKNWNSRTSPIIYWLILDKNVWFMTVGICMLFRLQCSVCC